MDSVKVENMEKLEFTASDRFLSGIYQCEANNGIGSPIHKNIILKILRMQLIN